MPTPVPVARQCLSPAAVTALDAAVASARRRTHAQTTSFHLISSLLAPTAAPLLRDALARARCTAYSPRLQLKVLELCFAVSLDRPSSSSSAAKVDLSHLVLAILDDPLVSRVFADAGFRSGDIKLAIRRSSSAASPADDAKVPSPAPALPGAAPGEDNRRRITEILSRGRNPMLVGAASAMAGPRRSGSRLGSGRRPARGVHGGGAGRREAVVAPMGLAGLVDGLSGPIGGHL